MNNKSKIPRVMLKSLLFIFPATILVGSFLFVIFQIEVKNEQNIVKTKESQLINTEEDIIKFDFQSIVSDLQILAENTESSFESTSTIDINSIERQYKAFSSGKDIYDQIRFIDKSGKEIVRVDYNNGFPALRERERLQDKSSRYYFTDSIKLERGEVFISPLDLNVENGIIERPSDTLDTDSTTFKNIWRKDGSDRYNKPMIRFATPVFNKDSEKVGIVILNYFGNHLMAFFDNIFDANHNLLLANSEGYWLKGISRDVEWGFMRECEESKDNNIKNDFPALWEKIKTNPKDQFESNGALFTYTKIFPLLEINNSKSTTLQELSPLSNKIVSNDKYHFILASYVNPDYYKQDHSALKRNLLILFAIISFFIVLASFFVAYLLQLNKEGEEEREVLKKEREFISIMSHQLRTPISSILLNLEVLTEGIKNSTLETIQKRLMNLKQLVNNLFIANEFKDDYTPDKKTEFSVHEMILKNLKIFSYDIDQKKLKIKNEKPEIEDTVVADKEKINNAIYNIINNAISYNKKEGEIYIQISQDDDMLSISFSDTGYGIPKKEQDNIFSKYFRASNSSLGKNEGSGVSLFLAKIFIEGNSGTIKLDSTENVGTTVTIKLPIK